MASLRVLPFDSEGRPVAFDTWHDDLQLYLLSDNRDSVSLFDHVSGAAPAPPATTDVSTRSQWLSRDATARLAIRNHLPATECAHFVEHRTAQALYDAVVARYSSPATAAIDRLLLPFLFPELSAFATVADLVTHLCTSDARYRATVPAEFLPTNQPPMFITLYFTFTRHPDSLGSVRDHFLTLDPTSLTVDLLEQHLLAAETSAVADVGAASTSTKRRNSKGKGGRGSGGGSGGGGGRSGRGSGGSGRGSGGGGGGGGGGTGGGGGGSGGGGGGSGGSGGSGGGVTSGGRSRPQRGGPGGGRGQQQQRQSETQTPQQLREWLVQRGAGEGSETCPYVIRTGARAGRTCGRSGVAIFDLDFDVIISAMYALSFSAEGDFYWCVPPDPSIASAPLGASASGTPPGPAPAEALHTFTLADPSGGPVVGSSSISSHVRQFRPAHYQVFTSPRSLRTWVKSVHTGYRASSDRCVCLGVRVRSLPPLTPSLVSPCPPCVKGRQRAAPQSSSFPQMTAPLQTLHMDVWGPARVSGQGRERYFLLVVDDYTWYTTVFPLPSKGKLYAVFIPWIRTVRLQLREHFCQELPVLRLHSDRGGEFSSDLLREFCHGEGILQSFTLPDSPQQNGIAERRIGLVMEVARTSMIHAVAPCFLWPFAVRYAAHQLNLWLRDSLPETSPTLRWTGKVGDAWVFRVWGSRAFLRDTSADKLCARAIPCVFLGFVPDSPGWQFYHPTSRLVLPSQDVTFDESVPFYRLFPYRSAPSPPPPLFLAPGPSPVDPLPPQGPAPSGVSKVDPLPSTAPVQVDIISGAAPGAASGGAASGGAEPGGAGSEGAGSGGAEPEGVEPGGAELEGAEPEGAESEGAESGGAEPQGTASSGGPTGASPRLSSQQLHAGAGGAAVTTRTGDPTEPGAAGAGGAGAGVAGVGGPGAGGAGGAGAGDPGAGGAGGTVRPRPYFVPLLQQVLGVPSSTGLPPPFLCPPPDQSQPPLQRASPLPVPSPFTEQSGGLTERREPASRPLSPVRPARRAPCSRPPPVPGTQNMALRPSSVPLRVPLPAPPESSFPEVPDLESDRARAASPTVARLLATAVTDPSFESAAASALVAELLDFAADCRLDYASALVAESVPTSPPSIGGKYALGTDVLEDRQEDFECLEAAVPCFASLLLAPEGDPDAPDIPTPRSYAEAITGPYSSQWQAAMDAEMASWKSTGTYVDDVPPPGVNIVDGMWIFRVVGYFHTFSPTPKMTTLQVLLHVAAQRDYELHSLDFSTAFLLRRPVYSLRQAPREWHDTLRTTLAALGFVPSTADPSLFLRTDTLLPPFYILVYVDDLVFATADTEALTLVNSELQKRHTCTDLGELRSYLGLQITRDRARRTITLTQSHMVHQVLQRFGFQYSSPQLSPLSTSHSLSAPPSDESVEPSGPYPELVGCLITSGMGLVLGGQGLVVLIGDADASWVDDSATQRSSQGYTFSLGSGSVSWWSTRSSSVLSSSCEAEIYAVAMAAQELRWLTCLLTDLGEQPRSPPVLYVDNKAMIALCQENRLEHRTKYIALRYFLARELQQRGQLRLAYVAIRANTADVFTKALPPGDHQRFVTVLGLLALLCFFS
ncbi:unnamed protein product [Closterium sp. NIES-53]